MTRTKKMVSLGVVLLAVVAATSAGAATAWKFITVRKQQVAVFTPGGWACRNFDARVDCQSGDAHPYAILTATPRGGITVKVVTLKAPQSGHVIRGRNRSGFPVWTFTAS
jgi:hypothetical protein